MTDLEIQDLIKRNPINPKYGCPVPLIMRCNVSGVEKKYTAPEYIKSKLDNAGGLEKFLRTYVGRGANKDACPVKAPIVLPVKEQVKIATTPQAPSEMITRIFLYNRYGEDTVTIVKHPRQNTEQFTMNVHDHRKDKTARFNSDLLFPSDQEILKQHGILLA